MPHQKLTIAIERHRLAAPFRISGYVFEDTDVVVATLQDGACIGRGEATGVYYLGDDVHKAAAELEVSRERIERCSSREQLKQILPAGGARNAVDCAMWELEAARAGMPAWKLAGITEPQRLVTTMTLGANAPHEMVESARRFDSPRAIKLKLTGEFAVDIERVAAVRDACPDVWLGVDANQGYRIADLPALMSAMLKQGVSLIEQPLARGREADLDGFTGAIPLAADESVLGLADVESLVGRFQVVNIKLDKCGGLTEGLEMASRARALGLGVMVGNMTGTSLAMAPAFILGQQCDIVDLDGPLFLAEDRHPSVTYENGRIRCRDDVWGSGAGMSVQQSG